MCPDGTSARGYAVAMAGHELHARPSAAVQVGMGGEDA